jgi:malate dehydrogenase
LLNEVLTFTDPSDAFKDVDVAILCGGFPRKPGMERKDVMNKNALIYIAQGKALDEYAKKDVKVLVVANPANTNALILAKNAPSIPKKNITALTRLDHNRALGQIAQRSCEHVSQVQNVIIWGNHSSTQVPDIEHGTIGEKLIENVLASKQDSSWLQNEFIPKVQQRGAEILRMRGLSSAASAASAACDHMRDWVQGTPPGEWVSMAVYSDGSYGQPDDVIYSFPCICRDGEWEIVKDLTLSDDIKMKLKITADELIEERSLALSTLYG